MADDSSSNPRAPSRAPSRALSGTAVKPDVVAPGAGTGAPVKPSGGLFGFLSGLLGGAHQVTTPPVAPSAGHSDPSDAGEVSAEKRFASLTMALTEIEPIHIDVPEKTAPVAPKNAPATNASRRSSISPSPLMTQPRPPNPAGPASASTPVKTLPAQSSVVVSASTRAPAPQTPTRPTPSLAQPLATPSRPAPAPALAPPKARAPGYVDDLRARAQAEAESGGIVHRRYLLTGGNASPASGGAGTSDSSSQGRVSARRGSGDELSIIVSDVMPQMKAVTDENRYTKTSGLLSDANVSSSGSPNTITRGVSAQATAGKSSADLFGSPGGKDDMSALLGLSQTTGKPFGLAGKQSDSSVLDALAGVNQTKPTLLEEAKLAPEPGLAPKTGGAGSSSGGAGALAGMPEGRPVFCPYCGNSITPQTAAKVTDKGDTVDYVCAHCGETVTIRKTPAAPTGPASGAGTTKL